MVLFKKSDIHNCIFSLFKIPQESSNGRVLKTQKFQWNPDNIPEANNKKFLENFLDIPCLKVVYSSIVGIKKHFLKTFWWGFQRSVSQIVGFGLVLVFRGTLGDTVLNIILTSKKSRNTFSKNRKRLCVED